MINRQSGTDWQNVASLINMKAPLKKKRKLSQKSERVLNSKIVKIQISGCARLAIANHKQRTIEPDEPDTNPRLTYCYAYKCLHNALSYCPSMKTPGMSQEDVKAMQRMNSMILVTLGFVCLRLGKYSEALNFTNKSLEKYPENGYNYFANMYKVKLKIE